MTIENKSILITGANRGIGMALLKESLRRGANAYTPVRASPSIIRMGA